MPKPINPEELDAATLPGDDFFGYVSGKWLNKNPIPPEEARWSSFSMLRVNVEKQLHAILDDLAAGPVPEHGSIAQKVRDFYVTAMDVEKANRQGLKPLDRFFGRIDAMISSDEMAEVAGFLHRNGVGGWWLLDVDSDEKNTELNALHFMQGGIGLPDRDYYLKDDEKSRVIRERYLAYMTTLFETAAMPKENVKAVMEIETALAKVSMTRVELRDVEKQYNKMTPAELAAIAPQISWSRYFKAAGIQPAPEYIIVGQPDFFKEVSRLFAALPLETCKQYLRWRAIDEFSGFLSEPIERAAFDFYNGSFYGAKEMKARWRRALKILNVALEYAVGQLYVERHFSEAAKAKINALVDHLTAAYRGRIDRLDWMGEETKKKAFAKLGTFRRKLGYPDTWRDYSALEIGTDSYAENYMRAYTFEFERRMRKIGKPIDHEEWYMSPQTVNACYHPLRNEILFPAAILQPPFFNPEADDAVNFGGIGSVIGHELTHGFDDQGALFDEKGNLRNWWTEEDKKRFDAKTKRLAEQYDAYEPLPGLHVNGQLTLGENIADLGGLLIAFNGLKIALAGTGTGPIDGFTPEQRFFIGYAITERESSREEILRLLVQTDPHSPSRFRVNGPLSNMDEFYEAFGVKEGNKLWRPPEERVKIW